MPTLRHFISLQYWQRFLWLLSTLQSLFPLHWYPGDTGAICFLILLLKNPLQPSQLMAP